MRLASYQTTPRRDKNGALCLIRTDDLSLTKRLLWPTELRGRILQLYFVNSFLSTSIFLIWWRISDSNRSPPACKADALPDELIPHNSLCSLCYWCGFRDLNFFPDFHLLASKHSHDNHPNSVTEKPYNFIIARTERIAY